MTRKVFLKCKKALDNNKRLQHLWLYNQERCDSKYARIVEYEFEQEHIIITYLKSVPDGLHEAFHHVPKFKNIKVQEKIPRNMIDYMLIVAKENYIKYD